ncbi:7631_t:CDS:2 [Acaulospora morrowiae]|uniref:7631_t:CDS:1 n=1 Tax=Acaulospora morrowiae TaxID=94023 RepID=A0A9N9BNX7_9GLOM|nr:7631_t:CDS:2 [Acaulospora morrowiae]
MQITTESTGSNALLPQGEDKFSNDSQNTNANLDGTMSTIGTSDNSEILSEIGNSSNDWLKSNTQENDYEFVGLESTMENSIQHFLQYQQNFCKLVQEYEECAQPDPNYLEQQRIPDSIGHPLLSDYKSLMTSIFYNPNYPDQMIYLQKNRESTTNRSLEELIEGQGFRILNEEKFGESSVGRFIAGINSQELTPGKNSRSLYMSEDNKNSAQSINEALSITTFCNPNYPDQIVHLQQTQSDGQELENDKDHSNPNIPMLLKKVGFIKLKIKEIGSSINGNINSSDDNKEIDRGVRGSVEKSTSGQRSHPYLSEDHSSNTVSAEAHLQRMQVDVQQKKECEVKPNILTASHEGNVVKSKTKESVYPLCGRSSDSNIDDGIANQALNEGSMLRQRKSSTLINGSPLPIENPPPKRRGTLWKQYITPKNLLAFLVVIISLVASMHKITLSNFNEHGPSHNYEKNSMNSIADSTENLVNGMGEVDLPPSDSIMKGTVLYKQFANAIESSPAFKKNGATIAEYLRQFSKKIFDAGIAFEAMYRKGDMLFWVLETQVNLILNKLNPSLFGQIFSRDDASYISSRLEEISKEIVSFERKLKKAMDAMEDAENTRDSAERSLVQGRNEAEKFVDSRLKDKANSLEFEIEAEKPSDSKSRKGAKKIVDKGSKSGKYRLTRISQFLEANSDNDRDYQNAKKHLEQAGEILDLLSHTAKGLDEIQKLLTNYRYSLEDAKPEVMGKTSVSKDEIDKLKKLIEDVKRYHQKFVKKSDPLSIDDAFY